jgi:hypothetical protein
MVRLSHPVREGGKGGEYPLDEPYRAGAASTSRKRGRKLKCCALKGQTEHPRHPGDSRRKPAGEHEGCANPQLSRRPRTQAFTLPWRLYP